MTKIATNAPLGGVNALHAANNFTILRLGLALLVVLGHFKLLSGIASPDWPFCYAATAVDCFFVVSGYLVTSSFDRDANLLRYGLRRLFRIYPLYVLIILAQTVLLGALQRDGVHALSLLRYFVVNSLFLNFMQYDAGSGVLTGLAVPGLNPSLWTLKIEVGFYAVLPFLWMARQRFGFGVLVALFFASAAYYTVLTGAGHYELAKQLPGQLQFFIVGMAGYMFADRVRLGGFWAVLAMILLAGLVTLLLGTRIPVVYPILIGALVIVTALHVPALPIRSDISYGVYLLHAPLIQISLLFGIYVASWWGLAVLLAVVISLAFLAERVIELPGIDVGRRLVKLVPRGLALPLGTRGAPS